MIETAIYNKKIFEEIKSMKKLLQKWMIQILFID